MRCLPSLGLVIGLAALSMGARAAEEPSYEAEGGTLVVRRGAERDEVPIGCKNSYSLARRADELFVACGKEGVAIFSLGKERPTLERRVETRSPCVRLERDGQDVQCLGADGALVWVGEWKAPPVMSSERWPAVDPFASNGARSAASRRPPQADQGPRDPDATDEERRLRALRTRRGVGIALLVGGTVALVVGAAMFAAARSCDSTDWSFSLAYQAPQWCRWQHDRTIAAGGIFAAIGAVAVATGIILVASSRNPTPRRTDALIALPAPARSPLWTAGLVPSFATQPIVQGSF